LVILMHTAPDGLFLLSLFFVLQESPRSSHKDSNLVSMVAKTIQSQTVQDTDHKWRYHENASIKNVSILSLFSGTFNNSDLIASNGRLISE
jgi:hypothetical protein